MYRFFSFVWSQAVGFCISGQIGDIDRRVGVPDSIWNACTRTLVIRLCIYIKESSHQACCRRSHPRISWC